MRLALLVLAGAAAVVAAGAAWWRWEDPLVQRVPFAPQGPLPNFGAVEAIYE